MEFPSIATDSTGDWRTHFARVGCRVSSCLYCLYCLSYVGPVVFSDCFEF